MSIDQHCAPGLTPTAMRSLNQYLLVDAHNKYSDYVAAQKHKGMPFVIYVAKVYIPHHYTHSLQEWSKDRSPPDIKIPCLHPDTHRITD